jgi:hypothetical protein
VPTIFTRSGWPGLFLLRTVYLYAGQSSSSDRIFGADNGGYLQTPRQKRCKSPASPTKLNNFAELHCFFARLLADNPLVWPSSMVNARTELVAHSPIRATRFALKELRSVPNAGNR